MFLRRPRRDGRLVVVAVAALLAGASGAATARHAGPGPATDTTRFVGQSPVAPQQWYGHVLAQDDLEPVAGARIFIEPVPPGGLLADLQPRPGAREDAVTDSDGAFALEATPDRRLRLTAPGFLDGFVLLRADYTVQAEGFPTVLTMPELADHRPIYALVRVFDEQGRPVPDSFATSHRMFRQRERPQHLITNLVPGRYHVEVETSDGRSWSGEAEVRAYEDTELVLR